MQDRELLKIETSETVLNIVQDMLFIGSPDDQSEKDDVVFQFQNGVLLIDTFPLSKAQLLTLKMYLNNEL
jgi:hypothetical protein